MSEMPASPVPPRETARQIAERIVGNCSGKELVEAIADVAMFGEHDPFKPWHVREASGETGTKVASLTAALAQAEADRLKEAARVVVLRDQVDNWTKRALELEADLAQAQQEKAEWKRRAEDAEGRIANALV